MSNGKSKEDKRDKLSHPIQPVALDKHGTLRFKENAIVNYILDNGGIDLNHIAMQGFSEEDHQQFAQLIGYSVSGFGDLSYASDEIYATAYAMHESGEDVDPKDMLIAQLRAQLRSMKVLMRQGVSELYGIHPDDLVELTEKEQEDRLCLL